MRRPSGDPQSYKTAAKRFALSGILFIFAGIVSSFDSISKIGMFLPVGIAMIIISMVFWQRSKKPADND